jgi:hypothetical protein
MMHTVKGYQPREAYYQRLMQVTVVHGYYNANDGECTDLNFAPTAAAAALMARLGLLFKTDKTGFSILYNQLEQAKLFNLLRRDEAQEDGQGAGQGGEWWLRLSFVATLNNDYFIHFSELPFSANHISNNFYFSNTQAHQVAQQTRLNLGDTVAQPGQDFIPKVDSRFTLDFDDARRIEVVDIGAEVIISAVRQGAMQKLAVDLTTSAPGRYSLLWFDDIHAEPIKQQSVLYVGPSARATFGFIDLLFTQPPELAQGLVQGQYPLDLASVDNGDDEVITPMLYQLHFGQRLTHWVYWVILKPNQAAANLYIEAKPNTIREIDDIDIVFDGPYDGQIANGRSAKVFICQQPLALQQQTAYQFVLKQPLDADNSRLIVGPLPVPSSKQVASKAHCTVDEQVLNPGSSCEHYSEMFVYV